MISFISLHIKTLLLQVESEEVIFRGLALRGHRSEQWAKFRIDSYVLNAKNTTNNQHNGSKLVVAASPPTAINIQHRR